MTGRQRLHETLGFGSPDRVPYWEVIGHWAEAVERWQEEGLPADVHLRQYFNLDRYELAPIHIGLMPAFKAEILEQDETTEVYRDEFGILYRRVRKGRTIPQYIRFPLATRDDWNDFKRRLNPDSPARYPLYWEDYKRCVAGRDYPLGVHGGSIFGWLRNWMGLQGISLALYDDPAWVQEMMDHLAEYMMRLVSRAVEEIGDIDYCIMWEDMCYRSGSLISPGHFKRMMVPCYRRITGYLRSHGVKHIMVDCDGNHDELIPLWLEGGVNGVYPLEVAAGEDPVALRKKYGRDLLLCGGIDKRVLARDKKAIEQEVRSKAPWLIEQGGWIPSIDHAVPPDVPFENYCYYWELLREIAERG